MKLVTMRSEDHGMRAGLLVAGQVVDLEVAATTLGQSLPSSLRGILEGGPAALEGVRAVADAAARGDVTGYPRADVHLTAALPNPPTVYLLAANYQSHIVEAGSAPVDKTRITPRVFIKPGSSVIGTGDPIEIPLDSDTVDYELEITAVIGTGGKHIPEATAADHVAGYVVFNDVSARDLTIAEGRLERNGDWFFDWLLGKWCDSFAVVGPILGTRDEIPDPNALEMSLWVNGELRQHSSAGEMIFSIPEAIAFLSRFVTLRPGDLVCMGTPGGVGHAISTFLQPGDEVVAEIEGLGKLTNPVIITPSPPLPARPSF